MRGKRGQAILESLIVLLVILAAFFFFFDFAYGMVVQLHLNNAAARAARADTVGFNSFQRLKAVRVAMLPVSGKRLVPDEGRVVPTPEEELALVRTMLQCESEAEVRGVLFYERWETLGHKVDRDGLRTESEVSFELPLSAPSRLTSLFGAVISPTNTRRFSAKWAIEDHASYYLQESFE
jgi:hypothetical protein